MKDISTWKTEVVMNRAAFLQKKIDAVLDTANKVKDTESKFRLRKLSKQLERLRLELFRVNKEISRRSNLVSN